MCITDLAGPAGYLPLNPEALMRKNMAFAFAAAALGMGMIAWAKASIIGPTDEVIRPKVEMLAPAASLNLPFQVLKPLY